MSKPFSLRHRKESFGYAFAGIQAVLRTEHNTWIHLALTIIAVVAGIVLHISPAEWAALVIVAAMVWAAELFNTALEKLADFITTNRDPQIGLVKDMAAAAVLVAAVAALVVGGIIFLPRLLPLIQKVICPDPEVLVYCWPGMLFLHAGCCC